MLENIIARLLQISFLIALFSCSESGESKQNDDDFTLGSTSKHLEISFGYWREELFGGDYKRETDALIQYMEERFNVTIVPKFVSWSDYTEKYNLWAASGELPDFFVSGVRFMSTYQKWLKQGVIRALPGNLAHYSYLDKLVNQEDLAYIKEADGKNYFLPRIGGKYKDELNRGILVRKDWMEKLGIADPQTWKEFQAMLRKFVQEDPNGSGVNDTYGLVPRTPDFIDALYLTLFPNLSGRYWVQENNRWNYPLLSPQMQGVIKELNLLYREKLMDPDFLLLNTFTAGAEKFAAGNIGALLTQVDPPRLKIPKDLWSQVNPDKDFFDSVKILATFPFPDKNGDTYRFTMPLISWGEAYFNAQLSEQKLDRILNILNFLFSDEGQNVWYRGIEGIDYKVEDGKYMDIRELGSDGQKVKITEKYPSALFWGGMAYWGNDVTFMNKDEINYEKFSQALVDMSQNYVDRLNAWNVRRLPVDFHINKIGNEQIDDAEIVIDIDDIINESIIADQPWKKFQSLLQEYIDEGLNDVVEKVNEQVEQLR